MRKLHGIDYPASDLADPIVTPDEARRADTALCPQHGGLIAIRLSIGDHFGKVYFCPEGRMLWRLAPVVDSMHRRLTFPRGL